MPEGTLPPSELILTCPQRKEQEKSAPSQHLADTGEKTARRQAFLCSFLTLP